MERIILNVSEECYEDIVKLVEEISGKEKAAAFRSLTKRKEEAENNPTDKRAKSRFEHAQTVAGLSPEPTVIKKYNMSDKPRTIS